MLMRMLCVVPMMLGLIYVVAQELGPPSTDPVCANPPMDQCEFYAHCLESRYQCGPNGYPLHYGHYYCQKFSNERDRFDARGQQWMLDTMHCLQEALINDAVDAVPPSGNCEALRAEAVGTHPRCYVDNGFCTLGVRDWGALMGILGVDSGRFWSKGTLEAMGETAGDCGMFYAYVASKGLF